MDCLALAGSNGSPDPLRIWRPVAPSKTMNVKGVTRSGDYSSVSGTIDASLPLGQFALSMMALAGLRNLSML